MSIPFEFNVETARSIAYNKVAGDFRRVSKEGHHDDGVVYEFVFEHVPTGRFFEFSVDYDSYQGYFWEYFEARDLREVRPVEKTIIVYEPI